MGATKSLGAFKVNQSARPGNKILTLDVPTNFSESELTMAACRALNISPTETRIEILRQSLDARSKHNAHWKVRVVVWHESFSSNEYTRPAELPFAKTGKQRSVIVVGSGPAGYFCALFLARSGFSVTLLEQGPEVDERWHDVSNFDTNGVFKEHSNYVSGEGGAGTFSDGKLTSRTKGIDVERNFIFKTYIDAGAPCEIDYFAHPHIGSDRLRAITPKLRHTLQSAGAKIIFNCKVTKFESTHGVVHKVSTSLGEFETNFVVFACGHSSLETMRMLIQNGVSFSPKPFAVGMRFEIPQLIVNLAQWKTPSLPGVKAAEYFLTAQAELPVYSFCMCPGGKVIPAMTQADSLVVNGVSNYQRNGKFANSAIVAGVDLKQILKPDVTPLECLAWRENIERLAHAHVCTTHRFAAPACRVSDFVTGKISTSLPSSTFPFPLVAHSYEGILDPLVLNALKTGFKEFTKKMNGFEEGLLIGVETTTSSPVRLIRDTERRALGFTNLFVAGEMSGWSGGIVSSAVDGLKTAQALCAL
jgi:uncharacterized FAD-dependent dehydrogenase